MRKLVIVSGRSGSGKSVTLHELEDRGFYCVDNLPMVMLPQLVEETAMQPNLAVGIDARNVCTDLTELSDILHTLNTQVDDVTVLFLDAEAQTLLRRFSETRRAHPLTRRGFPLKEALEMEQKLLKPIAVRADLSIDTTQLNLHQLQARVAELMALDNAKGMALQFQSFGFKLGSIASDVDYLWDVRCLPNPYWEKDLRHLTGRDPAVREFFDKENKVKKMLHDMIQFLEHWLPEFEQQGRRYVNLAIGCTGGLHRSVYVAETLAAYFRQRWQQVEIRHRELAL